MKYLWCALAIMLFIVLALPLFSFVEFITEEQNSPGAKRIEAAVSVRDTLPLSELFGTGRLCIFPVGTVVPLGEAMHIFGTQDVAATSSYNSHGYWFIALNDSGKVEVHPISAARIVLLNDDIRCGSDLSLIREGEAFRAVERSIQ